MTNADRRKFKPSRELVERRAAASRRPLRVRFERYVFIEPNCGCWLWTGSCDKRDYGQLRHEGKILYATHASLQLDGRPKPFPKAYALHSCDTPNCVNPAHLRWGTQTDNARDAMARNRQDLTGLSMGRQPRGHKPYAVHLVPRGRKTRVLLTVNGKRFGGRQVQTRERANELKQEMLRFCEGCAHGDEIRARFAAAFPVTIWWEK